MVTNELAYVREGGDRRVDDVMEPGRVARVVSRLNQALCGLGGHDAVRHFEGKRVMMRCTSCGHQSPGWEVTGSGPRQLFEGDARRHRLVTEPRLVLRKTA